ncbi:replication-relaxation family protein [Pelomonas sp. KK5]|uniref:replication-relaxation family protein n=1 Tax=Pelomonas sp. KK5 TaxID=1855730 RepID=UPI001E4A8A92|nr:replication-relaxation family protein [Pelomonas sp. KK5]
MALSEQLGGDSPVVTETDEHCHRGDVGDGEREVISRGLTAAVSTTQLRRTIWRSALAVANRFRVVRTIDVAACCFPERDYKAALSAAQRAMRGLVKAGLLRRYRTNRFQTVYGLTQRGADWLLELDIEAAASVRRVSDMTNPEHRLWSQFLVLAAEARGMESWTEGELLQRLVAARVPGHPPPSGLLNVSVTTKTGSSVKALRPDALIAEPDGLTWVEVDRSARGSERAADLRALTLSMGVPLFDKQALRRVVVFTRTDRIHRRVSATLDGLAEQTAAAALVRGRRQVRNVGAGEYEVWATVDRRHDGRRSSLVDELAGHVVVQALPVWLPKVRLDGRGRSSVAGWFGENYLPYRRPTGMAAWVQLASPLAALTEDGQ